MTLEGIIDMAGEEDVPHHFQRWENRWTVCIYEVDRHYGGPEEGGWWYNTYSLATLVSVEKTEADALAKVQRMNHLIHIIRERSKNYRKDLYSMAYSGGYYTADYHRGLPPTFVSDRKPWE